MLFPLLLCKRMPIITHIESKNISITKSKRQVKAKYIKYRYRLQNIRFSIPLNIFVTIFFMDTLDDRNLKNLLDVLVFDFYGLLVFLHNNYLFFETISRADIRVFSLTPLPPILPFSNFSSDLSNDAASSWY